MSDDCEGGEISQAEHLVEIHRKLDRLDESIRGNGRPGILVRLDRLERDANRHTRLIWLLLAAGIAVVTSILRQWIGG